MPVSHQTAEAKPWSGGWSRIPNSYWALSGCLSYASFVVVGLVLQRTCQGETPPDWADWDGGFIRHATATTGLTERRVLEAIAEAEAKGLLERRRSGRRMLLRANVTAFADVPKREPRLAKKPSPRAEASSPAQSARPADIKCPHGLECPVTALVQRNGILTNSPAVLPGTHSHLNSSSGVAAGASVSRHEHAIGARRASLSQSGTGYQPHLNSSSGIAPRRGHQRDLNPASGVNGRHLNSSSGIAGRQAEQDTLEDLRRRIDRLLYPRLKTGVDDEILLKVWQALGERKDLVPEFCVALELAARKVTSHGFLPGLAMRVGRGRVSYESCTTSATPRQTVPPDLTVAREALADPFLPAEERQALLEAFPELASYRPDDEAVRLTVLRRVRAAMTVLAQSASPEARAEAETTIRLARERWPNVFASLSVVAERPPATRRRTG